MWSMSYLKKSDFVTNSLRSQIKSIQLQKNYEFCLAGLCAFVMLAPQYIIAHYDDVNSPSGKPSKTELSLCHVVFVFYAYYE